MSKNNQNFSKIRHAIIDQGDRHTLRAVTDLRVPPYLLGLTHEQTGLILAEAQQRFAPELWKKRKDVQTDIALLRRQRDGMQRQLGEGIRLLDNKDERLLTDLATP